MPHSSMEDMAAHDGKRSQTAKKSPIKEMAELFRNGTFPITPSGALLQLISNIKMPLGRESDFKTIPQAVAYLQRASLSLKIDSIGAIMETVTTLELEADADMPMVCGTLIYLADRTKDTSIKRNITNLIFGFASSADKLAFLDKIDSTQSIPPYGKSSLPNLTNVCFTEADWTNLFRGIVASISQINPYKALAEAKRRWETCRQGERSSIDEHLYSELTLWTTYESMCGFMEIVPPSEEDRKSKLLNGLNKDTKQQLARRLKADQIWPERMGFEDICDTLHDIKSRADVKFDWEDQSDSRKEGAGSEGRGPDRRSLCRHCLRPNPNHAEDKCFQNPKNKTPSPSSLKKTIPDQKHPQEKDTAPDKGGHNLRPRGVSFKNPITEEKREHPSYPISGTPPARTLSLTATLRDACVCLGVDTFSSITLISDRLRDSCERIVPVPKKDLSGIGGRAATQGLEATVLLEISGKQFLLTGDIGPTPVGVDILIGTPQLRNMEAVISFENNKERFSIPGLDLNETINKECFPIMHDEDVSITLPKLKLMLDPDMKDIPYQCQMGYSVPHSIKDAVDEHIEQQIKSGILEEVSYKPNMWISPLFIKTKKGSKGIRLLADLRRLNDRLVIPEYWRSETANISTFANPIPRDPDAHFACIDISEAYHTCEVDVDSRHLLVVRYGDRLLQYTRAPQGLSASALFWPTHLSSGLNKLLGEEWRQYANVFVDDILIWGRSFSECQRNVASIVTSLELLGKPVSPKSVSSPQREITCVGINFGANGMCLSQEGIQRLKTALNKAPKSNKELRRLIGSIQYASNVFDFGDNLCLFGELMRPLNRAVNVKPFRMTDEIKSSVEMLTEHIRNKPLGYIDPSNLIDSDHCLVITTDASDTGIGGTLHRVKVGTESISDGELIGLFSSSLSAAEENFHTFELESLALYKAVTRWKGLLIASCSSRNGPAPEGSIIIRSDSSTALHRFKEPARIPAANAKGKRFIGWAAEVSFLRYLPVKYSFLEGDANHLSDLFSRIGSHLTGKQVRLDDSEEIWTIQNETNEFGRIKEVPLTNEQAHRISLAYTDSDTRIHSIPIREIYLFLRDGISDSPAHRSKLLAITQNRFVIRLQQDCSLLYTRKTFQIEDGSSDSHDMVLVIPDTPPALPTLTTVTPLFVEGITLKQELLTFSHECQGHPGVARTTRFLQTFCWWPKLHESVLEHVHKCAVCSADRTIKRPQGFQIVGSGKFSRIQLDHKILAPDTAERTHRAAVLTVIDTVTGFTRFIPTRTVNATDTAKLLLTHWIALFGIPQFIQCDNSTSFTDGKSHPNAVIQNLCTLLGTKLKIISPYNPEANGRVERMNRELAKWLSYTHIRDLSTLEVTLALAETTVNQLSNSFLATFGENPITLANAISGLTSIETNLDANILSKIVEASENNTLWNKILLEETSRKNSELKDIRSNTARHRVENFKIGDKVIYGDHEWIVESLRYGVSPTIPTSAVLKDVDDPSKTVRCKSSNMRPAPITYAIPGERLQGAGPSQNDFVFYNYGTDVFAGLVSEANDDTSFVHVYLPSKKHNYRPAWWQPSTDAQWTVTRAQPNVAHAMDYEPLTHAVPNNRILVIGKLTENGHLTKDTNKALLEQGVFVTPLVTRASRGHCTRIRATRKF